MEPVLLKYDKKKNCFKTPWFIHIELTQRCNAMCSQCYVDNNFGVDMKWATLDSVVSEISEMGIPVVMLTGGEPLLYPRLFDAITLMKGKGIGTTLSSSGIGLDENTALGLKTSGLDECYISLNGSTKDIHNNSRSHFHFAVAAIENLTAIGIDCGVNWVARNDNFEDFGDLVRLCKRLKVKHIAINRNKKTYKGVIDSPLNREDTQTLAETVSKYYGEYVSIDMCYGELVELITCKPSPGLTQNCSAGRMFFDILADGRISPCRHTKCTGNKNGPLSKVWRDSPVLNTERGNLTIHHPCVD